MHILNTRAAHLKLQKTYIANVLVNLQSLSFTFYEINILLKYRNREFKRFWADRSSSLQDTDEMFQLNELSINALSKMRQLMNKIIIRRECSGRHLTKNSSFDIQSLAD